LAFFSLSLALFCTAPMGWALPPQSTIAQSDTAQQNPSATQVTLPAGAKVELVLTRPVWAQTAKPGDPFYTQTNFPATDGKRIAIPAGSWVQGTIEAISRPTRRSKRAVLQVLFTKIIFANGYTVSLPGDSASPGYGMMPVGATVVSVTVEVSTANDLLLDNGAQMEMTLAAPLALDSSDVAAAIPLTRAPEPGTFRTATLCRPVAGTPGTSGSPDTVIPGSPGMPSTTIPGGPGMPDTIIPGTPATPPTVIPGIPGTSGTPDIACPAQPMVISSLPVTMTRAQSQSFASTTAH
jgi:hypothetical protein